MKHTYRNKTLTVAEWAIETGMSVWTIRNRLRAGWTIERALSEPPAVRNLEHQGRTMSVSAWSRETGIGVDTLLKRLDAGWSVERALTTPLSTRGRKKIDSTMDISACRDLERLFLRLKNDLQRSIAELAQAHVQAGKVLENAEKNFKSRTESLVRESLRPGVCSNFSESVGHRTHSTAQETT